ncbi:hypothetical protein MAR_034502 [Mya arenaria]|uniref:Uncharacterized protein n=1 Tax=Mya arenaria TaxID=6604 RepID=A0ABY7GC11_MYAAR|nr:uncharacterized protein LOC128223719 [Mya arenaria]WAR31960.1 hypothetical protein MAR_034502 [Mya arenaria]
MIIKLIITDGFRSNGQCTSVKATHFPTKVPGIYKHIDTIGDVVSGEFQVVATDNKCFSIGWCCTRFSAIDDTCDDPWLTVLTRTPKPDPKCLQKADQVLANIWQLRLGDLTRVPHGQSCLPLLYPPKHGIF